MGAAGGMLAGRAPLAVALLSAAAILASFHIATNQAGDVSGAGDAGAAQAATGQCSAPSPTAAAEGAAAPGRRFVLPGAFPPGVARKLLDMAPDAVVLGDGYGGTEKPLSGAEYFGGVCPAEAARWAMSRPAGDEREKAVAWARTYIGVARRMRQLAKAWFGAGDDLSFDFIQLSCRERDKAAVGPGGDSHAAHADNCYWNGTRCARADPARHWRSHTVHLYLHGPDSGDFEGGAFFYAPPPTEPGGNRTRVTPQAGQVVMFTSGAENRHGVEEVTRGLRCQLGVWLTEEPWRAAHEGELDAAESALSEADGALPDVDPHDWQAADRRYTEMCRRAEAGEVVREGRFVAQLPLPGEDRSVSLEVLSDLPGPQITRVRGMLTKDESAHIIAKASPHFKEATVFEGEELARVSYRTSSTSWLSDDGSDPVIRRVLSRIKAVTGLSLESAEELQIARYVDANEGKYESHLDWGTGTVVQRDFGYDQDGEDVGARVATFLVYLNEVDGGGATVFNSHNLSVAPEAGTAIFWFNLRPHGMGDEFVRHGACPVWRGEKYIMTKWIHERGNEALFSVVDGLPRVARDWRAVADAAARGAEEKVPLVRGLPCGARVAAEQCALAPLRMARACPGWCDEFLARGRAVIDGVISPATAARVASLARAAAVAGDGYHGERRPHSTRELFAGVTPVAAATWAASQPAPQRATAVQWAEAYVDAAEAAGKVVEERLGAPSLFFDYVHLTCRTADSGQAREPEGFSEHDGYLEAGDDLLVEVTTVEAAKSRCGQMPRCAGFTHAGGPTTGQATVYFKRSWHLEGSGWTSYRRPSPQRGAAKDSHAAHADNCFRQGADCVREAPFFYWRSHSAILFLHGPESGDFSGGNFFFAPDWEAEVADRVKVAPSAGRLVAFTSGEENIHGVDEVVNGTRCALAIWLTPESTLAGHKDELQAARSLLALDGSPSTRS